MILSTREKTLLDCAGALVAMAQEIEQDESPEPPDVRIPERCRWAYRLGQAAGYRYASEAITETLTAPTLRPVP